MFPIIPSHILSESSASASSPSSIGKYPLNTSNSCDNTFWNIWTEDFIRRRYLLSADSISPAAASNDESPPRRQVKTEATAIDQKRVGCFASCPLSKDTKSRRFDDVKNCDRDENGKVMLVIDSEGYLKVNSEANKRHFWVKSMNIADDTYSNNALLEISGDRKLRLKILRNVAAGDEVLLWFSEEILAVMGVPFLTPANIQGKHEWKENESNVKILNNCLSLSLQLNQTGKNCYRCTACNKTFENPNPLKLHIAKNCERNAEDELWHRLMHSLQKTPVPSSPPSTLTSSAQWPYETSTSHRQKPLHFDADNLRNFTSSPSQMPIVQSYHSHHQLQQHIHRFSAFQPPLLLPSPYPMPQSQQQPIVTAASVTTNSEKVVAAAAAQLETIVSNMGTSKQGHICIYCGKLYSRKYGLKIHIRTHTGFKPLKCKYCLRPFGDPSNLNKHIRLHVQEKSLYKCNLCTKILVRRRDLLRHMNIKHNNSGGGGATAEDTRRYRQCDNELSTESSNGYNDVSSNSDASAEANSPSSSDNDDEEFEMLEVD